MNDELINALVQTIKRMEARIEELESDNEFLNYAWAQAEAKYN